MRVVVQAGDMSAADELQRLEREIEGAERLQRQPPGEAKQLKPAPAHPRRSFSFDIGAAAGLLAGYAVGRLRR